eukprot:2439662-Pyramimonas_sp.AAC.1
MVGDVVHVLGEDLQWLFPLGRYFDEMSLDLYSRYPLGSVGLRLPRTSSDNPLRPPCHMPPNNHQNKVV